ncbi:hypothetical protein POM88_001964 [Heracleum sosnowskyi]|uniref:Uncharacterized protein n=1 Tax=Heracleum sosnowskyi TaxID=360622 RepID=A0AAD8JF95_9APIA|nr:hypothetical protein POM88_001964 [Heracleum sosnowskyi]
MKNREREQRNRRQLLVMVRRIEKRKDPHMGFAWNYLQLSVSYIIAALITGCEAKIAILLFLEHLANNFVSENYMSQALVPLLHKKVKSEFWKSNRQAKEFSPIHKSKMERSKGLSRDCKSKLHWRIMVGDITRGQSSNR